MNQLPEQLIHGGESGPAPDSSTLNKSRKGLFSATSLVRWRTWHRTVGAAACAALVLWSLSGAMHPLMSRYQPRPAAFMPPPVVAPGPEAPPLARLLAAAGIDTVSHARLVAFEARSAWQVEIPGASSLRYFDAADGSAIDDGEVRHARALARHYLGDETSPIADVARIAAFGGEYAWVNRLLPVYRVRFDRPDGMRVYVEPRSALLATLVDDRKALFNAVFLYGHTWRLPGLPEPLRIALAAVALLAVAATPVLGLAVWLARRGTLPTRGLRRWHRRLGLGVAIVVLASATSGSWHLAKGLLDRAAGREMPVRAALPLPAAALLTQSIPAGSYATLSLVSVAGEVYARGVPPSAPAPTVAHAAHHGGGGPHRPSPTPRYLPLTPAADTVPALDDAGYARQLASLLAPGCAASCDFGAAAEVTAFSGEYGFVNKLLPVWRFASDVGRFYVHPETGTLAARIGRADYAEGWTFAQLHKWQGLEFLGRWPRDLLQIAWALASASTAALGLRLFLLPTGPRRAPERTKRSPA